MGLRNPYGQGGDDQADHLRSQTPAIGETVNRDQQRPQPSTVSPMLLFITAVVMTLAMAAWIVIVIWLLSRHGQSITTTDLADVAIALGLTFVAASLRTWCVRQDYHNQIESAREDILDAVHEAIGDAISQAETRGGEKILEDIFGQSQDGGSIVPMPRRAGR